MNKNVNQVDTPVPVVDLDAVVQDAVTGIQAVYQLVPDIQKTPAAGFTDSRTARTISDEFLEASVVTVEAETPLKGMPSLDPARGRQVIDRNLRLNAIATAAEALARDVRYTMFRERREVSKDALHVYTLAKAYARRTGGETLVPHVRAMREALLKSRVLGRAKRQRPPAPAPAPARAA